MKNKFLLVAISVLMALSPLCFFINTPANIAEASDLPYAYVYLENQDNIISSPAFVNKQAGIFFRKITPTIFLILLCNDGTEYGINPSSNRYELPMANNLKYSINIRDIRFGMPMIFFTLTYDLERPCIYASSDIRQINNGEKVIRENVKVSAADNISAQLFVSYNGCSSELCEGGSYIVNEEGRYSFYAIDKANNRSDNFTITYYEQEPANEPDDKEQPDDTEKPSEPSKPNRPSKPTTPDESAPTLSEDESTSVKPIIVIALVIAVVIIGIVVFVIVYKTAKAKAVAAQFDDEE